MSIDQATKDAVLATEHTQLAAEITDEVRANLPQEKALAAQQMAQTAKEIKSGLAPGTTEQGLGQPMGSIPPIIFHRWNLAYPGCWSDKQFKDEFFHDNPDLRYPGYKPRPKRLFFDMKYGNMKLNNYGGDFYVENKARIKAEIASAIQSGQVL